MDRRRTLALLVITASLAGCGFHLRGTNLIGDLAALEVRGAVDSELGRELRAIIGDAWSTEDPERMVIVLRSTQRQRRPISVTEQARTAEYALTGRLAYSILDAAGVEHVRDELAVERIYEVDTANLLGSAGEEDILYGEIRRELAAAVLRRARAVRADLQP